VQSADVHGVGEGALHGLDMTPRSGCYSGAVSARGGATKAVCTADKGEKGDNA
jgi:hypothetical protein